METEWCDCRRTQGFMSVLLLVFLLVKINFKSQKGIYSDLNDRLLLSKDAVCTGRSHRTTGHTIWDMLFVKYHLIFTSCHFASVTWVPIQSHHEHFLSVGKASLWGPGKGEHQHHLVSYSGLLGCRDRKLTCKQMHHFTDCSIVSNHKCLEQCKEEQELETKGTGSQEKVGPYQIGENVKYKPCEGNPLSEIQT